MCVCVYAVLVIISCELQEKHWHFRLFSHVEQLLNYPNRAKDLFKNTEYGRCIFTWKPGWVWLYFLGLCIILLSVVKLLGITRGEHLHWWPINIHIYIILCSFSLFPLPNDANYTVISRHPIISCFLFTEQYAKVYHN